MQDKEIIQKLLAHYEHHYSLMPVEFGQALNYLAENHMIHGLCNLSDAILKIDIHSKPFITDNYRWGFHACRYWHKTPFHCESMSQVRRALLMRIKMLKEICEQ